MVKLDFFKTFRIATCLGLVILLGSRFGAAPAPKMLFFSALALLWFVATLLWCGPQSKLVRSILRHNAEFAAVDGYLVMMMAAMVLEGVWQRPVLLMGAYVFMAGLTGGPQVGVAAACTTFLGLVNGWLLPEGDLRKEYLLLAGGTALVALVCGVAWWLGLPLLARMMRQAGSQEAQAAPVEPTIEEQIAALEVQLREMSAERDRAQERLSEWEAKQQAAQTGTAPEPAHPEVVAPETNDPALQAKMKQLAEKLTDSRAERAALLAEKQKLTADLADLTKELAAVRASAAEARPAATAPQEGELHANG